MMHGDGFSDLDADRLRHEIPDAKLLRQNESKTLGECLNYGIAHSCGEYIAKLDDDDLYGANYLSDMLIPFSFTTASVVGKLTVFVHFENENQTYLKALTSIIACSILSLAQH